MAERPDISMSADEVRGFLATKRRAVVAALDAGAPVGTVAEIRLLETVVEVTLAHDDPVRVVLAVDDRVCVIAEQFPTYYEIKGEAVHGRAQPVDGIGGRTFRLSLDDPTSFDFGKLPRTGAGSGTDA